jgi:hypothetical protein
MISQMRTSIHHGVTEDSEKFKSVLCREIPAKDRGDSACGKNF